MTQTVPSLSHIVENLQSLGVPLPLVPEALMEELHPFDDLTFGSMEPGTSLYQLEAFVAQFKGHWPDNYMLYGVSGHGMNSRAVHFYLVTEKSAVFLQRSMPLFNPQLFSPEQFSRDMMKAAEICCHPVLESFKHKLVVVDSDMLFSRVGRWENEELNWLDDVPNAIAYARNLL